MHINETHLVSVISNYCLWQAFGSHGQKYPFFLQELVVLEAFGAYGGHIRKSQKFFLLVQLSLFFYTFGLYIK